MQLAVQSPPEACHKIQKKIASILYYCVDAHYRLPHDKQNSKENSKFLADTTAVGIRWMKHDKIQKKIASSRRRELQRW